MAAMKENTVRRVDVKWRHRDQRWRAERLTDEVEWRVGGREWRGLTYLAWKERTMHWRVGER